MSSISRIAIEQQFAEIGVRVTPAKVHINIPRPEMRISMQDAEMRIEREMPTFKINKRQTNAEIGLKSPVDFSNEISNNGKQAAYSYASTSVRDGNYVGDVTKPGNRVAQLAKRKFMIEPLEKRELNIDTIPKSLPEVEWDPGSMRINWSKHSILIEWDGEYMPEMTVDPKCSVEIFLRNKPYFKVTVIDDGDPFTVGRQVDEVL